MTEQSEFLSPNQCFIIYDALTKKVAISLRNCLSHLDVKCTIWNEKQFADNEARFSNFNRLLILSEKVACEYLAAPTIPKTKVTDYVYYKREGRVAALLLINDIKFDDVFKCFEHSMKDLLETLHISEKDTPDPDVAIALNEAFASSETQTSSALTIRKDTTKNDYIAKGATLLTAAGTGIAFGLLGLTAEYGYFWYKKGLNEKDKKQVLLFAAAREFEKKFFDDFVNAK